MSFRLFDGSICSYADAADQSRSDNINYCIRLRQEANGEEKTPPLTNPSPAEIWRIIDKRYNRAKINVICNIHGIKCAQSVSKATLLSSLIVKFGAAVLDDEVLHRPPTSAVSVAMDTSD